MDKLRLIVLTMNVSHPARDKNRADWLECECAKAIDTCRNVINAREDRLSEGSTWPERLQPAAVVVMDRVSLDRDARGATFQAC